MGLVSVVDLQNIIVFTCVLNILNIYVSKYKTFLKEIIKSIVKF